MGYIFDAMNRSRRPRRDQDQDKDMPVPTQPEAPEVESISTKPDLRYTAERATSAVDLTNIDDRLVTLRNPGCSQAEEYRAIRTNMLARWENRRHVVHTITSATPQEGKTITSLNMGVILSELRNRKTIVIEGDLRLPQFQKLLNLPEAPGMIGVLSGNASLDEAIQTVGENGLHVLPAGGRVQRQAVQLLGGTRMVSLLENLRQHYDHIVIDTPPVVELADAGILGALSDEVLLVARMNRTPRTLIEQALRTLKGYHAPVTGLVATDQTQHRHRYYYLRYGYRYNDRYYAKAA